MGLTTAAALGLRLRHSVVTLALLRLPFSFASFQGSAISALLNCTHISHMLSAQMRITQAFQGEKEVTYKFEHIPVKHVIVRESLTMEQITQ